MRSMRVGDSGELNGPQSGKRLAYTLVEMLLVLAVIGTLAAMTWPSVLRMQADHELSSAAEEVRLLLAAARTQAIKSGLKHQFLYEPNGKKFVVVPLDSEQPNPQTTTSPSSVPSKGQKNSSKELPSKVTFASPQVGSTLPPSSQKISAAAFQGLDNAGTLAEIGWSDPLVFSPDGSAMDAVITVKDHRGQAIDLTLRGLTGATATGPMRREAAR